MRFAVTCERCGGVLKEWTMPDHHDSFDMGFIKVPECPACSNPVFGSFTVPIMARALSVACGIEDVYEGGGVWDELCNEARFVLRLLTANEKSPLVDASFIDPQEWLIAFAKGETD